MSGQEKTLKEQSEKLGISVCALKLRLRHRAEERKDELLRCGYVLDSKGKLVCKK